MGLPNRNFVRNYFKIKPKLVLSLILFSCFIKYISHGKPLQMTPNQISIKHTGTIWQDDTAIAGAPDVVNALQDRFDKKVYLITNNGLKTRQELFERSQRLGFHLPSDRHIISPTAAIADYLVGSPKFDRTRHKVYVVGNAAIARELRQHGIDSYGAGGTDELPPGDKWPDFVTREFGNPEAAKDVGAVVVGWDEYFSYCKMARACHILCSNPDAAFLVTNRDAVHKYPSFCIPGTGAFVAGIEACSEREALEMGKPNPLVLEPFIKAEGLRTERTLMIGDWYAGLTHPFNLS